jgi:hypothetical protein
MRAGEEDEGEVDSDSDPETSAKARYFGYIKQGLYLVTEMERFAPPRKRPRTITKNYRLVSLRSTTPEELYQRKVSGPAASSSSSTIATISVRKEIRRGHVGSLTSYK